MQKYWPHAAQETEGTELLYDEAVKLEAEKTKRGAEARKKAATYVKTRPTEREAKHPPIPTQKVSTPNNKAIILGTIACRIRTTNTAHGRTQYMRMHIHTHMHNVQCTLHILCDVLAGSRRNIHQDTRFELRLDLWLVHSFAHAFEFARNMCRTGLVRIDGVSEETDDAKDGAVTSNFEYFRQREEELDLGIGMADNTVDTSTLTPETARWLPHHFDVCSSPTRA